MFMSLQLPPATVDVNVHPTKREVHFLYQDDVVRAIQLAVEAKLVESNGSRTFALGGEGGGGVQAGAGLPAAAGGGAGSAVQSLLPGARRPGARREGADDGGGGEGGAGGSGHGKTWKILCAVSTTRI